MDVDTGEHSAATGVGDLASGEQEVIEDLLGRPSRKGALKRGFKVLPRIRPYLRPYRKLAVLTVILTLLLAVVALAEPWPLAFAVDSIIGQKGAPGWVDAIFGSSVGTLIAVAVGATLFLTLLSGLMTVWNEYVSTSLDQRMVLDFRSDMFQHAQKLSLAYHDNASLGILMYRLNNQASAMGQIVVALPAVAQSVITVVGMAYISFRINPLLAALALGTTPFIVYSTTFYTEKIEPRLYRVRGLGAMNLAIVYESMAMMRVVLAFGTQGREFMRFRRQGERFVNETVGLTVRQTAFKFAVQLITSAGTAAVIGVGAYQAVQGEISAGQLLVILSYISQVYQPLEELTNTITNFQQQFIGLLMSFELMDQQPEVKEKRDARPVTSRHPELELDGVSFGYKGRPNVLKDISLRIPAGRAVAIVGPTGAGKSTLTSLLPRFYDPAKGSVRMDGHDMRDLKLADVRDQFSIVLQEPLLFSGTIANNIRYGKPSASTEEVIEAAKAAGAHEFISSLPDGYETPLGERGAKISGGERQRIAVARAFLKDAPILILDEPTSSIDSHTEEVILEALERLMKGRTTIVIAHRLSTIRGVEEIVVMDHGRIVQQGSHEDLAAQPGLYRQLWEAQILKDRPTSRRQPERAETRRPEERAAASHPGAAQATSNRPDERAVVQRPDRAATEPRAEPSSRRRRQPRPPAKSRPKIVLLGMLTKIPVAGVGWLVGQYAVGFERLGFEVYYVEAHARTPSMFTSAKHDDPTEKAVRYVARMARRFGLEGRWAFQALHENGRCYGMSVEQLDRLYRDAALIINMHGGTLPLPEHIATERLVFLGTDPVDTELEVSRDDRKTIDFLNQHVAFFTWGLNYGNPDCKLPWASPFPFIPSPPPVVLDFWHNDIEPAGPYTTIGNWRQNFRNVRYEGRVYRWSKHQQFMGIIDLPGRVKAPLELALSSYDEDDRRLLAENGWRVLPGLELSRHLDTYRDYIVGSAGEVSAAKEQNVHFCSGWFSERSATYLAAGRPVILQDTGFGAALPTGEGLFAFSDDDEAAEAINTVEADPARHRRAARELAREYLAHDVVLGRMLGHVGLRPPSARRRAGGLYPPIEFPSDLRLTAGSGTEAALVERTAERVLARPVPAVRPSTVVPIATVIVPVSGSLVPTRLSLESVLANSADMPYEVVVVDDRSGEPVQHYLEVLAARNTHVRLVRNNEARGFAAACDQGLKAAVGEYLVLMRNDVIASPGWLGGLSEWLDEETIGMIVPAANRQACAPAVAPSYMRYGEMVRFAQRRREEFLGNTAQDINALALELFCAGLRRDVLDAVGPIDVGLEGDKVAEDYARRIRAAGLRVACTADVFVHRLDDALSMRRDEDADDEARGMAKRLNAALQQHIPKGSKVVFVNRDDEEHVRFDGHEKWHAPEPQDGAADNPPLSDEEVIAGLESLRERGIEYLILPATSVGWLERFERFRQHLERYPRPTDDPETAIIYELTDARGRVGSRSA
jgi:ATP-binding cassette subfamily B protein